MTLTIADHEQVKSRINALQTLGDCRDFYETNERYRECIRLVRVAQRRYLDAHPTEPRNKAREQWARTWALELAGGRLGAEELNRCRKTALLLLYRVCDVGRMLSDSEAEAYQQIRETFEEKRMDEILVHFLPMDRANSLFNMEDHARDVRGLGWYSVGDEEAYQKLPNPPLALNARGHTINRRLRGLQRNLPFVNQQYGHWLEIAAPESPPPSPLWDPLPPPVEAPPRVLSAKQSVVWVGLWDPENAGF